MVAERFSSIPTKCPVCSTCYVIADNYEYVECFGQGMCPARLAGVQEEGHVLCACNARWVSADSGYTSQDGHAYDDCIPLESGVGVWRN